MWNNDQETFFTRLIKVSIPIHTTGALRLNLSKLYLISSSTELTLLKLGPFLTMSDIVMDIINGGLNISSGNPASAAIGYAMLLTCFLYPGKDVPYDNLRYFRT